MMVFNQCLKSWYCRTCKFLKISVQFPQTNNRLVDKKVVNRLRLELSQLK